MQNPLRLVLASTSPRRASLLREHGYEFNVLAPALDEPAELSAGVSPANRAEALSYYKARSVVEMIDDGFVLGADTVVSLGEELFGKPQNREHARGILRALAGTTHHVITGVTLLDALTGDRTIGHDITAVTMKPLSPLELDDYLATGAWEGKAGAYGIQDRADEFITHFEGSFTNVVGLPMELVEWLLEGKGVRRSHAPS